MRGTLWRTTWRYADAVVRCVAPRVVESALQSSCDWRRDEGEHYCPRCGSDRFVSAVGRELSTGCPRCRRDALPWVRLTRLGRYREPLSDWIVAMKFHRQWCWAEWFGDQLAEALPTPAGVGGPVVVPVPMPWRRRWWRGFNQSALLAQRVASVRGWEACELLHRLHHTPPQTRVAYDDRARNVAGSFAAAPVGLERRPVVLIDDVKTTGSTLAACAKLLKAADAGPIYVGVIAVAQGDDGDDAKELDA